MLSYQGTGAEKNMSYGRVLAFSMFMLAVFWAKKYYASYNVKRIKYERRKAEEKEIQTAKKHQTTLITEVNEQLAIIIEQQERIQNAIYSIQGDLPQDLIDTKRRVVEEINGFLIRFNLLLESVDKDNLQLFEIRQNCQGLVGLLSDMRRFTNQDYPCSFYQYTKEAQKEKLMAFGL